MKIASNYLPFGHLVFFEVMLPPTSTESSEPEFCLGNLPPPLKYFLLRCSFFICVVAFITCVVAFITCVVAFIACVVAFFICVVAFFTCDILY